MINLSLETKQNKMGSSLTFLDFKIVYNKPKTNFK